MNVTDSVEKALLGALLSASTGNGNLNASIETSEFTYSISASQTFLVPVEESAFKEATATALNVSVDDIFEFAQSLSSRRRLLADTVIRYAVHATDRDSANVLKERASTQSISVNGTSGIASPATTSCNVSIRMIVASSQSESLSDILNDETFATVVTTEASNLGVNGVVTSLPSCDVSVAPVHGSSGDCASRTLASGSTCQPVCSNGLIPSGVTSCTAGVLYPATCVVAPPPRSPPPPPKSPPLDSAASPARSSSAFALALAFAIAVA